MKSNASVIRAKLKQGVAMDILTTETQPIDSDVKRLCSLPYSKGQFGEVSAVFRQIYSEIFVRKNPPAAISYVESLTGELAVLPETLVLTSVILASSPSSYNENTLSIIKDNLLIAREGGAAGIAAADDYEPMIWASAILASGRQYGELLERAKRSKAAASAKSAGAFFGAVIGVAAGARAVSDADNFKFGSAAVSGAVSALAVGSAVNSANDAKALSAQARSALYQAKLITLFILEFIKLYKGSIAHFSSENRAPYDSLVLDGLKTLAAGADVMLGMVVDVISEWRYITNIKASEMIQNPASIEEIKSFAVFLSKMGWGDHPTTVGLTALMSNLNDKFEVMPEKRYRFLANRDKFIYWSPVYLIFLIPGPGLLIGGGVAVTYAYLVKKKNFMLTAEMVAFRESSCSFCDDMKGVNPNFELSNIKSLVSSLQLVKDFVFGGDSRPIQVDRLYRSLPMRLS